MLCIGRIFAKAERALFPVSLQSIAISAAVAAAVAVEAEGTWDFAAPPSWCERSEKIAEKVRCTVAGALPGLTKSDVGRQSILKRGSVLIVVVVCYHHSKFMLTRLSTPVLRLQKSEERTTIAFGLVFATTLNFQLFTAKGKMNDLSSRSVHEIVPFLCPHFR